VVAGAATEVFGGELEEAWWVCYVPEVYCWVVGDAAVCSS